MKIDKTVVIVENEPQLAEKLSGLVREISRRAEILLVDNILDGYKLVRKKNVSLLITGIELGADYTREYPGIRLIRQIRKHTMYQFLPIIVTTKIEEYQMSIYQDMNCVGFFLEPVDEDGFRKTVARIMQHEEASDVDNMFSVRKHNVYHVIHVRDLIYVESYKRALHIHMRDGSLIEVSQKPIQYIIRLAKSKSLFRCARGTLVNTRYIIGINNALQSFILADGSMVRIGRTYIKRAKEVWSPNKRRR